MRLTMSFTTVSSSFPSLLSNNDKVIALESTLQQSLLNFKDLISDMDQLHIESEKYKTQFIAQKEKCDSKSCNSAEILKKIIESKDHIIQLVASALTRLNETKNLNILDEIFKILFGETAPLPSHKEIKSEPNVPIKSPKKELHLSMEDVSFRDESVSEIDGTPTGRTSPIIQSKKFKTIVETPSDFRDKKKCPGNWSSSENKSIKLLFSSPSKARGKPSSRLRQGRLNLVRVRQSNVVDLTSSPEYCGGRSSQNENDCKVQPLVKKESADNDDTVLPSPTSLPTSFTLFKSSKDTSVKFKKPPLSLKAKTEKVNKSESKFEIQDNENKCVANMSIDKHDNENAEDSINLLNPKRLLNNNLKHSPLKQTHYNETTYCDTQASVSLLQHVKKLDDLNKDLKQCSPNKLPLAENKNITNTPSKDLEASISLLQPEQKATSTAVNNVKKKIPEFVEVVYKEAAPRKKAEKRLLPGWSCQECKEFFGELYKDDPVMLARKIDECSKHRGKHDPARPQTPPNYWNPRWEVPENTEEFNRKNNVA